MAKRVVGGTQREGVHGTISVAVVSGTAALNMCSAIESVNVV